MLFLTKGKTNWKYVSVVLILTVIVGGGILGYLRYINRKTESLTKIPKTKSPVKAAKEETANWKTYRNKEYGFEIKYPEGIEVQEGTWSTGEPYLWKISFSVPCAATREKDIENCYREDIRIIQGKKICEVVPYFLEIGAMENPLRLPIKKWVQQEIVNREVVLGGQKYKVYREVGPLRKVVLSKIEGIKTSLEFESKAGSCDIYFLPKNLKIYSIGVCLYNTPNIPCILYPDIEKILSTFRFLE